jgi:hypothetical protein
MFSTERREHSMRTGCCRSCGGWWVCLVSHQFLPGSAVSMGEMTICGTENDRYQNHAENYR